MKVRKIRSDGTPAQPGDPTDDGYFSALPPDVKDRVLADVSTALECTLDRALEEADETDWTGHVIEYLYVDPPHLCEHDWQPGVITVGYATGGPAMTSDPVRFCPKCQSIEPSPKEPA